MSEQTNEQIDIPTFTDKDKREAVFHNWDEQPEVVGKLTAIKQGQFGHQYEIETKDGIIIVGTLGVLASKINETDTGKFVKIVFTGLKQSKKDKRRSYKDFEVFVK
jgi:hypothetical protein